MPPRGFFPGRACAAMLGDSESLAPAGVAGRRAAGRAPLGEAADARGVACPVGGVERDGLDAARRVTGRLVLAARRVRAGLELSLDALVVGFAAGADCCGAGEGEEGEDEGALPRSGRGVGGSWGTLTSGS